MIEKVHALLQEFEDKQAAGRIETFKVLLSGGRLIVQPQPTDRDGTKKIDLTAELFKTLQIFFSDIDGILFNSYDYFTLKSLLNAHGTLERMANRPDII